jgi:hypothetical protein
MLKLPKLRALQLVPSFRDNHFAVLHCQYVDRMSAERTAYSGPTGILSFRCWALFGGSYRILVILIAVYACCLGLQIVSQNSSAIATMLTRDVEVPSRRHIQPARDIYTRGH